MSYHRLSFLHDPHSIISSQSIYHHKQPQINSEIKPNFQNKNPVNMFNNFPPPGSNYSNKSSLSFCQVLDSTGNPIEINSVTSLANGSNN